MFLSTSCLSDWLDIKPDKKMVLPASLKDIQALMDNTQILNIAMPAIGEVGTDDYFIADDRWQSMSSAEYRNAYIWAEKIYEEGTSVNWNNPFQAIFYANLALESLDKLDDLESLHAKSLRGSAHFFRAWAYFQVAQIYCDQYDVLAAPSKLGLPLRVQSDINLSSKRSSIKETYDLIREDIGMAITLLPEKQDLAVRPSKAAAYGLSAIFHLQTGDYQKALEHAVSCSNIYNTILDYNLLNQALTYPFRMLNEEVIFHSSVETNNAIFATNAFNVVHELYADFDLSDLRRELFFRSNGKEFTFKGSYNGNNALFNGIATDEIILIQSECLARLGKFSEARQEINSLLKKRYKTGSYHGNIPEADEELLDFILRERRKQLIFRGRRWWDLRRLNKDPRYAKVLQRVVVEKRYELNSNSPRYTLPFPDDVIRLSGMEQNAR